MKAPELLAPHQHQATPNWTEFSKLGQESEMQTVHCPNCGSHAERHYLLNSQLTRTQCDRCDYLMTTCSRTGRVVEAYAPGIYPHRLM
jgi:uncharacterized paraquat-inducible protein A